MVPIPPISLTIPNGLDDLVRSEFEAFRNGWFNWLLFWTAIVAVGLLFELPEIWHDTVDVIHALWGKPKGPEIAPWMKLLVSVGWLLIVVGVSGELVTDNFVSRADGIIQTFDETLIADTQRQTELAKIRAGGAYERAAQSEKEAAQLRKDAEKMKAENLKLEAIVQPRTISVEDQRRIADACCKFKGHGAIVQSYGLDAEGFATGSQIIDVLRAIQAVVADARATTITTGPMEAGIHVRTTDASEVLFASCFADALNKIGKLKTDLNDPYPPFRGAAMGGGGQSITGPHITVMVGIKPLPLLTAKQSN
jgi:hypothetical protein